MAEAYKINEAIDSGAISNNDATRIITSLKCFMPCVQAISPGTLEEGYTSCDHGRYIADLPRLKSQASSSNDFPNSGRPIPQECQNCKVFEPALKKFKKLVR